MKKEQKIKILNIVGARPNFMKIAPLYRVYKKHNDAILPILIHTNQHKDKKMSEVFFQSLGIPKPDYNLSIINRSPISDIAQIIMQLEKIFQKEKPDLVLVVGDVNSTLAGAITANKMGVKVAHVESGLRSNDRTMPEEINRIIVDHVSDLLFVTEKDSLENLKKEDFDPSKVFFVGNTMIDNLIQMLPEIEKIDITERLGLEQKKYAVMTMHRPSNVDSEIDLKRLLSLIENIIREINVEMVFPVHPRTIKNLEKYSLIDDMRKIERLKIIEPMDYIEFIKLVKGSAFILTDSGGIQEEAAYLKVQTITLRGSTERPSTIECGANHLLSFEDPDKTTREIKTLVGLNGKTINDIPLNDGKASERIVEIIIKKLNK